MKTQDICNKTNLYSFKKEEIQNELDNIIKGKDNKDLVIYCAYCDCYHKIERKTSKEWYESIPKKYGFVIYDPDGWDRQNYNFSFNKELITKENFMKRVMESTCFMNSDFTKDPSW